MAAAMSPAEVTQVPDAWLDVLSAKISDTVDETGRSSAARRPEM
jgi:hypothetical protein